MSKKNIYILIPYEDSSKEWFLWGNSENDIDFRKDIPAACRCTTAFAAMELKLHLERNTAFSFQIREKYHESGTYIKLSIKNPEATEGSFSITPTDQGVEIQGIGRCGLIFGIYEFLRLQGWNWLTPGRTGEIVPELTDKLVIPESLLKVKPTMKTRFFHMTQHPSRDSRNMLLWMARNRINCYDYRPASVRLAKKLGMRIRGGGHIFEKILNPDQLTDSGDTFWDKHREWYGMPADGIYKKADALNIQFCTSNIELTNFLSAKLLEYLMGEWESCDIVALWGFDTWGSACQCEKCQLLGNETDKNIHFFSNVRAFLDKAMKEGKLDHKVCLEFCSYEGTCTMEAPTKPFPENIVNAEDAILFWPIDRCYAHDMTDSSCNSNSFYNKEINAWFKYKKRPLYWLGEYYNVSKYDDLPLLFSKRIIKDLRDYAAYGMDGMTYMHIPFTNWAVRTLTQMLFAQLIWDINTDTDKFIRDYFKMMYGEFAEDMHYVYDKIEYSGHYISQWRNWNRSFLAQLLRWNGETPTKAFDIPDGHFKNVFEAVSELHKSVKEMEEAYHSIAVFLKKEKSNSAINMSGEITKAANPIQAMNNYQPNKIEIRLGEDLRLLRYGIDTFKIMAATIEYYSALQSKEERQAESAWAEIEKIEADMELYCGPIMYDGPGPGIIQNDAFTRTQLRSTVCLCRKARMKQLHK